MIKRNVLGAEVVWWDVLFIMKESAVRYFHGLTLYEMNVTVKALSQAVIYVLILPVPLCVQRVHVL
jgi:hypothetical protein